MDNFMDKLAERYNASEMIKANSQAENARMEGLQEQVEAYEAVLQEMRKLNYKNTELTEKMYSLVDESLEKVRTLQLEACEGGANPELISREMSDAVTGALNEALNNMDSTVAKTISESLASALAEPTEGIKQTSIATVEVSEKLDAVEASVASLTESSEVIYTSVEEVLAKSKEIEEKLDDFTNMDFSGSVDVPEEFYTKLDTISRSFTDLKNEIENRLDSVTEEKEQSEILYESPETVGTSEVKADIDPEQLRELVDSCLESPKASLSTIIDNINAIYASVLAVSETVEKQSEKLESLNNEEKSETLYEEPVYTEEAAEKNDTYVNVDFSELENKLQEILNDTGRISEQVSGMLNSSGSETDLSGVLEKEGIIESYVKGLWDSIEAIKASLGENAGRGGESEELRAAVVEIVTSVDDLQTSVRNLRAAQDETRNTLKTSLDSAIYGLKQDNREIVEFLQRMNSNILAPRVDPEKEKKEEEAKQKEEDAKKLFEDRMKANEDFMHKESVKVYRNVQAVLNEKTDRQTDGIEIRLKELEAKVSTVKVLGIVAVILGGADIVLQVLKILGIF